jgi:hypothetical protein
MKIHSQEDEKSQEKIKKILMGAIEKLDIKMTGLPHDDYSKCAEALAALAVAYKKVCE